MTTVGLVLGKFAPLHKGHQLLLDAATAQTDQQVVVIYDSPDVTDIPLQVRASWLRDLYPNAEVIEAWGGPTEVGLDPLVMKAQEDFLVALLRGRRITHFFSSEEYGFHTAKALGCEDVRVDQPRNAVPISATAIRQNPFALREYLHPLVYEDFVQRIVFLGAPSTGKSTIAEACAKKFGTRWMPEFGREYWEAHAVDRRLTQNQLVEIAIGHREREDKLVQLADKFLFVDTDASTTEIFCDYYHQATPNDLARLSRDCLQRYDVVFLCKPDFAYADTEDRSGEANQLEFQRRIESQLAATKRPHHVLQGSVEERLVKVAEVLSTKKSKFKV